MKKVLLFAGLGLAAFIAGAAGLFFLMPSVAPDYVATTKARLDSLAATDTLPPPAPVIDSLTLATMPVDSALALLGTEAGPVPGRLTSLVRDTMSVLQARLDSLTRANARLTATVADLRADIDRLDARTADAKALSATVSKLEEKELRGLVEGLDQETLALLYQSTSSRNQGRLLQAMTGERAARFVRSLVRATSDKEPVQKTAPAAAAPAPSESSRP